MYEHLLAASPVPVKENCSLPPNVYGLFDSVQEEIRLSSRLNNLPRSYALRTLLHELAHALAFELNIDSTEHRQKNRTDGYARGEAIAEGATYITAKMLGIDTDTVSAEYIAAYAQDVEKFMEWAEAVQKVAKTLTELFAEAEERVA